MRLAEAASAAARQVTDGDAVVHAGYGAVSTRDYLRRLTITRSLVAHYVATYLGSTACPLPEELARPLWERDRFLLSAGHEPHPLGH